MTLLIDGAETTPANQLKTWGDLVAFLDDRLATTCHVVTAVRLDGVDEPAFRDPSLCGRPLSALSVAEIETGDPRTLARRCLGEAAGAFAGLTAATREVADQFRCDAIAPAREQLEQVCQGLAMVLRIVTAAGLALRRELDVPDAQGRSMASISAELDRVIHELVASQQQEDWIHVADVLEYDLLPILHRWRGVLVEVADRETPLAA